MAAAQLVLVTAAEGQSLVGASNFASKLPLAATGKLCQRHAQHEGNCFRWIGRFSMHWAQLAFSCQTCVDAVEAHLEGQS